MSTTADMLATVPMFAGLDDHERAVLAERVDIKQLAAGELLFQYGDPGDYMVILKRGKVELFVKTKTGDSVFLETVGPGEFFGEISLLDAGPRTAAAKCVEDGEAIIVDRGDLDELLKLQPSAAMDLLVAAGKRMRSSQQMLRNQAARNANDVEEKEAAKGPLILRVADAVAAFSGSITFLLLHMVIFFFWIILNLKLFKFGNWDTYPFGLLTMAVSLEAIMLSTLLLFSSNRQGERDRIRANIEYDVNLKAELQIQHMHEKIDQLHAQVLARLDSLDPKRRPAGL